MAFVNKLDFPPLPSQNTKRRRKNGTVNAPDMSQEGMACSPATLDDLPDELILDILDYLPGMDQQDFQLDTLLSLSSTTRHLHRVVSERLYATYDSYFCEPYLFLRTLISNPHLAENVRHAKFRYGDGAHVDRTRYRPNARDKKVIKEGMRALDFPDWKGWASRCNVDDIELDILHTAVLLHTPNLVSLDVEDGHISAYSKAKWPELIKKATMDGFFGRTHQFNNLKSVRIDAQNMVIHHLVPLLRLQSLRQLQLRELTEIELDIRAPAKLRRVLPKGCNNLEELILEECSLSFDSLTTLISSAQSLKSFCFHATQEDLILDDPASMLQNALRRQADSLESLDIYNQPYYNDDNEALSHGGLEKFPVLSKLKCPLCMVVDVHSAPSEANILGYLPPALTNLSLFIRQYTSEEMFLDVLEGMASEYATKVPNLRTLQLDVQVPAEEIVHDWEPLVKAWSDTKVELVINLPSESDDEFGDWRTLSTDFDDTDDSDEVDLYSEDDSSDSEDGFDSDGAEEAG